MSPYYSEFFAGWGIRNDHDGECLINPDHFKSEAEARAFIAWCTAREIKDQHLRRTPLILQSALVEFSQKGAPK